VARKMILKSGKEVKITQHQMWAVRHMFQDCPPEVLEGLLCCSLDKWLSIIVQKQNSCCEQSRVLSLNGRS